MLAYSSILVVIDPVHEEQPALSRALFLAKKYHSKLILCSCIYDGTYEVSTALDDEQKQNIRNALMKQQGTKLSSLIDESIGGVDTDYKVVWHKKTFMGIINTANENGCDLIVKSTKKHEKLGHKLFTPTDWHLIRNSSVNVLLVKEHHWVEGGNVVCAVGVKEPDKTHQCLSQAVTECAYYLNKTVEGNLHFINTYNGAPVHISIEVPQFSAELYNEDVKKARFKGIEPLVIKYNIPEPNLHIEEGLPEDAIPALCNDLDAQLLVLGSVGRKGLTAALLGNTAEHIIDQVHCDTLVVKPQ